MNHVDSDLEEGEILDDSPSPFCPVKHKELPRRYVILEKSPKHKRDCKYAIRHHAKKLAKLKKTPIRKKVGHAKKSHHKSCSHRSSSSSSDGPFKDYSIISPNAKSNKSESAKIHSKTENVKILKDNSFAQMLEKYKAMQSKTSNSFVTSSKQMRNKLIQKIGSFTSLEKECDKITNNTCSKVKIDPPEVIVIDDDDNDDNEGEEEELRRIALATCAKKVLASEQPSENLNSNLDCSNICVPELTSLVCNSNYNIDNQVADNYEVVDMEVDEDNSPDTTNNLFVIDTKPASEFQDDNKSPSEQKADNCSGDDSDFETDMLRAELINTMFTDKSVSDELVSTEAPHKNLHNMQASLLKLHKQMSPQNMVNTNSKHKLDIPTPVIEENKSPQRFIISLNEESSSEESDEEDFNTVNTLPENPVASIEALISDIRQQSDVKKNNKKVVPKAVSCLSRAQQEEYNALVKILSDKKRMPQDEPEVKNKVVHSPMDDLLLLEKKLMAVREDLKKQKVLMTGLSKQVTTKKQFYLRAKLSVQSLKEKLVMAEKVRRVKLDAWSKSCQNFETVKQSVSSLELKLNNLQDLCSKIGLSIQGQNYTLPSAVET